MRSIRDRFAGIAATAAMLLLAACGGGTGGDAPPQQKPELILLGGTAYLGEVGYSADVRVRVNGRVGPARTVAFTGPFAYSAKVDNLAAPYAAGLHIVSDATGQEGWLLGVATGPGTANATPLSTLAVALGLGVDPSRYFPALAIPGDEALSAVTAERIATGQDRATRYLTQQLGLDLPPGLGDFNAAPFVPTAGDPMFDTIEAFDAALRDRGLDLVSVMRELGAEGARCNIERLRIDAGGVQTDFCPAQKLALIDTPEPGATRYRFATADGSRLEVTARGRSPQAIVRTEPGGRTASCSGGGCAGLAIGAAAADGSRALSFAAVRLAGTGGPQRLDGMLRTGLAGPNLPPLPCESRYDIVRADSRVESTCVQGDDLGYGAGRTESAGALRRVYTFSSDGSTVPLPPSVQVRADGETVVSVAVFDVDPATGRQRVLNKCIGSGCVGVTIGPPTDDATTFAPYVIRTRPIVLEGTSLPAVDATGVPTGGEALTVYAGVLSVEIVLPAPLRPAPCDASGNRVAARFDTGDPAQTICPPQEAPGFDPASFLSTGRDPAGELRFTIANLYLDGLGSATQSGGLVVSMDGEAVAGVTLALVDGTTYACEGAACAGVEVAAPGASGGREIAFTGTRLTEIELGGLPGIRHATLDGGFVAPPP